MLAQSDKPGRLRRLSVALACAAAFVTPASTGAQVPPQQTADLTGLWSAKKWFGPEVRGPIMIGQSGGKYWADVAGQRYPVARNGDEVFLKLPDDRGELNARFEGHSLIRGHWIGGRTAISYGRRAFPVALRAVGQDQWLGTIDPGEEEFSFYLFARRQSDGTYGAVLRNPEFDLGNQRGVRKLTQSGDEIRLVAARGNAPEQVLASGRLDRDSDSFSLYFPGRGGSYDFARDGDASLAYPRPRPSAPYRYTPPPPMPDGWRTGTLQSENIDVPAMERLVQSIIDMPMDQADAPEIHALLIARHGRLLLEEYFHGFSREKLHTLRSAGKSIAGTTIGAAMHAGAPLRLDSRVYDVMAGGKPLPALEPRKAAMTLENLLTMSSGHYCDDTDPKAPGNEDYIGDELQPPNVIEYFMSVPMATDPGRNSVYCSMQPHLALSMLQEASHESPLRLFDRLVARPMEIMSYSWPLDTNGRPYGGGSVALRARDFTKFGQLMLNGGTWNGRRILDASFAKAAVAPQYHLRNVYYGYLWWVEYYPYKGRQVLGYSARGAGGNLVFVVPELDLVMTTMAGNYSNRRGMTYLNNLIATSVLPAVREAGDDPNAPVRDLDWASPYGKGTDGSRVTR